MDKKSLQAKLDQANERFEELKKQEATLLEQAKELNQNLGKVREEMVRVQGDYRTINGLMEELEGKTPSETATPEKK